MTTTLSIIAVGQRLGTVTLKGNRLTLRYEQSWRESSGAFPLSVSMPMMTAEHSHSRIDAFLRGLLPDSDQVIDQWAKRFHVSAKNPFKLLEHVGEDCAGAIQFIPPEREETLLGMASEEKVTWLSEEELAGRIRLLLENHGSTRTSTDTGQFSLAGAQPKTALFRDTQSGRWGVPEGPTPTTHILKPATGQFDGYAENEHFCLKLAQRLGLQAAVSSVIQPGAYPAIVVQRYDRVFQEGRCLRIHQEDLCQALSVPPSIKYQNEGGPSVKDVAKLLWDVSSEPAKDVRRFADALIFNWLIVGTDAHAKNYSLLIAPGSQVRLAPLYDLASALPYPAQISPHKAKLAMKVGSKYRIKEIVRRHWEDTAKELKIPASELLDRMIALANAMAATSGEVASALHAENLNHPIIGVLGKQLRVRAEECLRLLDE